MSASKTSATVVHQGHGRTRLRFKSERGNNPFFDGLVPRLTSLPDVKGAEARALTGSVVIHHQGPWSETAEQISEAGLFVIAEEDAAAIPLNIFGPDARSEIAKHLSRTGFFVENEQQALKSLESMAPPLIAAGGAAALALLQIARGHALPPAITLLMYARALAGPFIATLSKE